MGLLDNILGGAGQQQGGMSPINMALMALLAYRTYEGKGRLADMLGRHPPGTPPIRTSRRLRRAGLVASVAFSAAAVSWVAVLARCWEATAARS